MNGEKEQLCKNARPSYFLVNATVPTLENKNSADHQSHDHAHVELCSRNTVKGDCIPVTLKKHMLLAFIGMPLWSSVLSDLRCPIHDLLPRGRTILGQKIHSLAPQTISSIQYNVS